MTQPSLWRWLALGTMLAGAVAGCSPEVAFPAIHDMPPPRADAPLTPDQVKQATDDLISERNHLSTEMQAATAAETATTANVPAAPPPKKKKKAKAPAPAAPTQQAAAIAPATADGSRP